MCTWKTHTSGSCAAEGSCVLTQFGEPVDRFTHEGLFQHRLEGARESTGNTKEGINRGKPLHFPWEVAVSKGRQVSLNSNTTLSSMLNKAVTTCKRHQNATSRILQSKRQGVDLVMTFRKTMDLVRSKWHKTEGFQPLCSSPRTIKRPPQKSNTQKIIVYSCSQKTHYFVTCLIWATWGKPEFGKVFYEGSEAAMTTELGTNNCLLLWTSLLGELLSHSSMSSIQPRCCSSSYSEVLWRL